MEELWVGADALGSKPGEYCLLPRSLTLKLQEHSGGRDEPEGEQLENQLGRQTPDLPLELLTQKLASRCSALSLISGFVTYASSCLPHTEV